MQGEINQKDVPWASFGRETAISRLAKSVLPVGNFPAKLRPKQYAIIGKLGDPNHEQYIMEIQGTAFQAGRGKLLTCWHVCETLRVKEGFAYVQSTAKRNNILIKCYWPIVTTLSFVDPRTKSGNKDVDVGAILCAAVSSEEMPYEVPIVEWGDSSDVGVGDPVLIGGYPLGRDLFLALSTNRGLVQPTFYDGIISAIIPATRSSETRLFQISSVAMGGISGGVVCDPRTGKVLGKQVA